MEKHKSTSYRKILRMPSSKKWKIRFSLTNSAPIMSTLLGERLRYLSNKALARAIITGTYEILFDMDPATKLIKKK